MKTTDFIRVIILGNSGSGKTYLSKRLGALLNHNLIHIDQLFWEPGGYNRQRPKDLVHQEVINLSNAPSWIMEGVFGELTSLALPRARSLIFLDKSWDECSSNLRNRGSESLNQIDPVKAESNFEELFIWAEAYWNRTNQNSFTGHKRMFEEFTGPKFAIRSHQESDDFIRNVLEIYKWDSHDRD